VVAEIILIFGSEREDSAAVDANERGVGAHGGEAIANHGERKCQENKIYICLPSPSHAVQGDHTLEGIGQPRAARIISLEQPAQQWYMRGSDTEIER